MEKFVFTVFKKNVLFSYYLYRRVCVYDVCVNMITGTPRVQKRDSDPLELELEVVINHLTWVLGTKLGMTSLRDAPLAGLQNLWQFRPIRVHPSIGAP